MFCRTKMLLLLFLFTTLACLSKAATPNVVELDADTFHAALRAREDYDLLVLFHSSSNAESTDAKDEHPNKHQHQGYVAQHALDVFDTAAETMNISSSSGIRLCIYHLGVHGVPTGLHLPHSQYAMDASIVLFPATSIAKDPQVYDWEMDAASREMDVDGSKAPKTENSGGGHGRKSTGSGNNRSEGEDEHGDIDATKASSRRRSVSAAVETDASTSASSTQTDERSPHHHRHQHHHHHHHQKKKKGSEGSDESTGSKASEVPSSGSTKKGKKGGEKQKKGKSFSASLADEGDEQQEQSSDTLGRSTTTSTCSSSSGHHAADQCTGEDTTHHDHHDHHSSDTCGHDHHDHHHDHHHHHHDEENQSLHTRLPRPTLYGLLRWLKEHSTFPAEVPTVSLRANAEIHSLADKFDGRSDELFAGVARGLQALKIQLEAMEIENQQLRQENSRLHALLLHVATGFSETNGTTTTTESEEAEEQGKSDETIIT